MSLTCPAEDVVVDGGPIRALLTWAENQSSRDLPRRNLETNFVVDKL
jgi:hypothetical protein